MTALDQDSNAGTTAVRDAHRFDEAMLATWMAENVADYRGALTVRQFKGGQSNPTYRLDAGDRAYVLRRAPPGPLVEGAHDVLREARILSALATTDVPVARIHGICTDACVIGTPFFVMELVAGRIFWDATFAQVPDHERADHFDAMNTTIAALHAVDYTAIGLGDYGRPGNYFARQIARWSKQYLDDGDAGRDTDMDTLMEWLPANIPDGDETSIVHGDFRCDNIIFDPVAPRILAVLDWELSTLGHPLADFAYHALMYRMPPDIVAGLGGAALPALRIPSEADYVAAYCARTARAGMPDYDYYIAFNFFRLAAIFHGIKGRVMRGTAASAHARERVASFPRLARLARQAMEACR
jgi:aminoglycoside phosphotransferase (APT) family kinase protein